jgi:hypothetical protein
MSFKFVDLFAGIGGFHAALGALGGECVYASEWDKDAARIYERNWNIKPDGDITLAANDEVMNVPPHDVLVGGFPCQPFSIIGKSMGFADTRGTLFFNIEEILKEKKPYAFMLENVKQLQSHDDGRTLKVILEKLKLQRCKVIFSNLTDEGFGTSITIDATDEAVQEKISNWVKVNIIGKETPGVAKFKEYTPEDSETTTIQYAFKVNDFTKFMGLDGLAKEDLGYGAIIDLISNPFPYDNKFGKGISSSLSAVLVKSKGTTGADADMDDLLADINVEKEVIEPINAFK